MTERQLNIPRAVARKYGKGDRNLIEELESLGYVALLEGFRCYDPGKGKLDVHLYNRVRWGVLRYFDDDGERRWKGLLSLDRELEEDFTLLETLETRDTHQERLGDVDTARLVLSRLPPLLRTVYLLRNRDSKTLKEVGEQIGVHTATVRSWQKRAEKKVRDVLAKVGRRHRSNFTVPPAYRKPPVSDAQKSAARRYQEEKALERKLLGDIPCSDVIFYLVNDTSRVVLWPHEDTMGKLMDYLGVRNRAPRSKKSLERNNEIISHTGWRMARGGEARGLVKSGYLIEDRVDHMKESLPSQRRTWRQKVKIEGTTFYLDCGEYADGRLGEVFLSSSKTGSFTRGVLETLARVISSSLQEGVTVERLVHTLQLINFPPNGPVTGSPVVTNCTSVSDWVAQEINAVYCSGGARIPPAPSPEEVSQEQEKSFGYVAEDWRTGV